MGPAVAIAVGLFTFLGGCLLEGRKKSRAKADREKAVKDAREEGKTLAKTEFETAAKKAADKDRDDELARLRKANEDKDTALRFAAASRGGGS